MIKTYKPSKRYRTRFKELAYEKQGAGNWRFIDTETGAAVGKFYTSKAELEADITRYAEFYGCESK